RRSWEPGIRYPRSRPESNHLLTVRGATLQILATCPVVKIVFMAGSPMTFCRFAEGCGPSGDCSYHDGWRSVPCGPLGEPPWSGVEAGLGFRKDGCWFV